MKNVVPIRLVKTRAPRSVIGSDVLQSTPVVNLAALASFFFPHFVFFSGSGTEGRRGFFICIRTKRGKTLDPFSKVTLYTRLYVARKDADPKQSGNSLHNILNFRNAFEFSKGHRRVRVATAQLPASLRAIFTPPSLSLPFSFVPFVVLLRKPPHVPVRAFRRVYAGACIA